MVYSFFLSNFATKALVITSDTYSKFIKEDDRSTRTLFSDGATCTVIKKNLKTGWVLENAVSNSQLKSQDFLKKSNGFISMNGPQVLLFSINTVMKNLITIIPEEDCTIFAHQAGKIVLDTLKKKLPSNISFPENYDIYANLVSSSIPSIGKAAQLIVTNSFCRRRLSLWIACAINSLPVPVSPIIKTLTSLTAIIGKVLNKWVICGDCPKNCCSSIIHLLY